MPPKIFLCGATGYIGGTVLDTLVQQHPEYDITVLLRSEPTKFRQRYPNVQIVRGDYDGGDVLSEQACKAEIVIHCGMSDHEPAMRALLAGLAQRTQPAYLIHLSGTGIVADWHDTTYHGRLNPKIWSDVADIAEMTSLPDTAFHRKVDRMILNAAAAAAHGGKLRTAISISMPMFVAEAKKVGAMFYAGEGANARSWVHIEDLMQVYVRLVEAAVDGGRGADWGEEAYYFAGSQEASQREVAAKVGRFLKTHGVLATAEPKQLPFDEIALLNGGHAWAGLGTYLWAANSRTRADLAEKLFGFKPSAPSLWETLEEDLLACIKG
ncbi:hypothetical protein LTR53_011858 [Teratosphaeriaceae sp. CCFEE 6253]|nr:hypothetical protein LTR53_011858 [Teratosphaeriaceae sp. CCFEE 6253]